MTDDERGRLRRVADRASRFSPAMLAIVGILIVTGVAGGGYYAYRTYDYVQHDNDFCMSCHLMADPYEAFGRSAHQGLGCKACHRPNLIQRSRMGLTAIVENPDEVSAHAAVPNEICAECHIEGDPEKWRLIANSAGHRVHLESDDPALGDLQCVECHATSIHEFAPIDKTCAQSGCHEDSAVQLGAMSDLTIHCAACHTFVAPVAADAGLLASPEEAALLPNQDECLSCHAMRALVEMPEDDPHEGSCAACHNPHEQTEPAQAAESCATAGCHEGMDELTPFHRGLELDVVTNCLYCHVAHDFSLDGSDCASCHEGAEAPTDVAVAGLDFQHAQHEGVSCGDCHSGGETHGEASVSTISDCRSCHHETSSEAASCESCHAPEDGPDTVYPRTQAMQLDVGVDDPARVFQFPHGQHVQLDCASCHSEGLALTPPDDLDCQSCHEDHHEPTTDCAACHQAAPVSAHPPSEAHVTCSGAGCHTDVPFDGVPRTRPFCLGCHQDLRDHEPGRVCADCHTLPEPRQIPGDGRAGHL